MPLDLIFDPKTSEIGVEHKGFEAVANISGPFNKKGLDFYVKTPNGYKYMGHIEQETVEKGVTAVKEATKKLAKKFQASLGGWKAKISNVWNKFKQWVKKIFG
ncbi:uncharacterized protein LOC126264862 isoform X2 [Aethina tumida]|uniref:uncharacterized protein LOC126264862 isoform X2 n=1 Tax=Aethina tumida TaxID=116153 RepID=UPI002147E72C|nr:uncharacterized protein LOC126264862 isoform X2 [Aethina tumida]